MLEASSYFSQKTRNNVYTVSCIDSKVSSNAKALITDMKLGWDFQNYLTSVLIFSQLLTAVGNNYSGHCF